MSEITEATAFAIAQAVLERVPDSITLRPGTVRSLNFTSGGEVSVQIDGDVNATSVQVLQPLRVVNGDRVMVMFYKPAGALVLGVTTPADAWHVVGAPGQPTFNSGWAAFGSPFQVPRFRRDGDRVIVNGLMTRTSGSGTIAWTMPAGYRPLSSQGPFAVSANQGAGETQARFSVQTDGDVIQDDASITGTGHRACNFEYFLS